MKKDNINLLIIGHSEHGKSYVAERIISHFGWTAGESSYVCKEIVFDALREKGIVYDTPHEAWLDRRNNKQLWKDIIRGYNEGDLARLTRKIFEKNEIYVGLRAGDEFLEALKEDLFDIIIYVDASERLPNFDPNNLDIPIGIANIVIDNNGTLEELGSKVNAVILYLDWYIKSGTKDTEEQFSRVADFGLSRPYAKQLSETLDWFKKMKAL